MTMTRAGSLRLTDRDEALAAAFLRELPAPLRSLAMRRHARGIDLPRALASGRTAIDRTTCPTAPRLTLAKGIALRAHQAAALAAWSRQRQGVVVAPCGAGKTTLALAAATRVSTPVLVLVHTRDLEQQWLARASEQLAGLTGTALVADLATSDKLRAKGKLPRITVALIQSLHARVDLETWGQAFGLVVLDEAHHAPASTWGQVVGQMAARHRLAVTATPERADGGHPLLFAHFGPIVHTISVTDLEVARVVLQPVIRFYATRWAPTTKDPRKELALAPERNERIVDLVSHQVVREQRTVLVLVERVEHVLELTERLQALGLPACGLTGKASDADRADALRRMERGELRVLVATKLADEALDLPVLDTVVLGAPCAQRGLTQQRVGRIIRKRKGKRQAVVWDLVDVHEPWKRAAMQRDALYVKLGWRTESVTTWVAP